MVISDNLYQFGVAIDAARREWEVVKGRKADMDNWEFRDFLSMFLSQRGVMIAAVRQNEVNQIWNTHGWADNPDMRRFKASMAAAFGCTQVDT